MPSLDELLHPITPESFAADYQGCKPLHIPAVEGSPRRDLLTWDAFNALLNQGALWTANNLRLMQDAKPVPPEQYCRPTQGTLGRVMRPSPAKVAVFLSGGASLIASEVVTLHPPIADLSVTLGRAFAGEIGANVYCSFKGVQAFGTHYDLHDVFAIQTGGEKVWRLYENCAVLPVEAPPHTPETQRYFEQNRGRLMTEVRMRPGDVLYLPRGWYHDALAEDGPSLHVTMSVLPLNGRTLLSLLDRLALQEPLFREYLPPADHDGGRTLADHLSRLGQVLADLAAGPALLEEVAMTQERVVPRPAAFALPARGPLTLYRTTGRAFPAADGQARRAHDWFAAARIFAMEEAVAQLDFIAETDVRQAIAVAERAGALMRTEMS